MWREGGEGGREDRRGICRRRCGHPQRRLERCDSPPRRTYITCRQPPSSPLTLSPMDTLSHFHALVCRNAKAPPPSPSRTAVIAALLVAASARAAALAPPHAGRVGRGGDGEVESSRPTLIVRSASSGPGLCRRIGDWSLGRLTAGCCSYRPDRHHPPLFSRVFSLLRVLCRRSAPCSAVP